MKQSWRVPILCAAVAVFVVAVVDWVLIPLNEAGRYQWGTAWLAGVARLLQFPGLMLGLKLSLRVAHQPAVGPWCFMMAANTLVYLLVATVVRWIWWGRRREPRCSAIDLPAASGNHVDHATGKPCDALPATPAPASRRQFMVAGAQLAFCGAAAAVGHSFVVERERFIVTRHTIPIRGLHKSLQGMTIAQLSDIHHGPWTSLAYVRRVIEATNALNADIIALTGDYVLYSDSYVRPVVAELTRLRASVGVVGVLGNHDWFEGGQLTKSEFRRAGIPLIDNSRRFLSPDRKWSAHAAPIREGLCVAGLGDLWGGRPDYGKALVGVHHDMPRLLLSHNPDTAELSVAREGRHRVDLMVSGHTHGGQIWVPGFGSPIIPSSYGQKYARGLVNGPSFRVFVSSGLGTTVIPVRFCRPPEIALITLTGDA